MAITYHAGRRIQGTSNSVTNWVEASGTNGTGAGQYDSSNTSGDNSFNYDTTNNEIDFDVVRTSNTPNCMMKDITSSTNGLGTALSTTNWRMRFKIYWDNWEDKGDITLWLGLCSFSRSEAINGANSNDVRKPTGGDNIGLMFTNANLSSNCWNNLKFYYGENEDDTTRFGGDAANHAVDLEVANTILSSGNYNCNVPTDDTYYWCEIIRDGSTVTFNCSKTAYGLSDVCGASNSATGKTTSGTASSTFGTTRPLKYFYVGKTGGTGGSAHIQGMIRDLQIENTGSSSVDRGQLTNVQVGSRFEETDTRKIYHYGTPVAFDDPTPVSSDYTNTGSSFTFASNKIHVDAVGYGSTLTMCTRPLTSSFVPTTNGCIIDFKFNWTTAGGSGNDTGVAIGLWDARSFTDNTNNGICLEFVTSPSYSRNVQYRCEGVFDNSSVQGYPVPDEYYCRIIVQKDGSSTGKGYTSESDRTADTNAVFSRSTAAQTGFSSKTLFGILNVRPTGGANVIGDLDNMKVYTGLVATDTAWSEEGT